MKKLFILAIMLVSCVSMYAQSFNFIEQQKKEESMNVTKHEIKEVNKPEKDAGFYLKRSAAFDYASVGCVLVGTATALIIDSNRKELKDPNKVITAVGVGFGVLALTSHIISIHYKYKAGKSLTVTPTSIRYNF